MSLWEALEQSDKDALIALGLTKQDVEEGRNLFYHLRDRGIMTRWSDEYPRARRVWGHVDRLKRRLADEYRLSVKQIERIIARGRRAGVVPPGRPAGKAVC